MSRVARLALAAGAAGLALLFTVLGVASGGRPDDARRPAGEAVASLKGAPLYVDPSSDAAEQERRWTAEGRSAEAKAIRAISRQPGANWFGEPDRDPVPVEARVARLTTSAQRAGQVPLIVIYSIPFRDCGSFSSGGSRSAAAYGRYVKRIADGIGDRPALVVLEPDATGHIADGCVSGRRARERERTLARAIKTLGAKRRTHVYLDGGNAGWIPAPRMAPILRRSGLAEADGFAVNVANFQTTAKSVEHARAISRRTGGKHFVVDTGRNGSGPWRTDDPRSWCNPPGRTLGTPPTTDPKLRGVDALLWVKHPGASDGTCRSGPPAGQWWPEYALGLTRGS